jgi:argininosuccinate lyase
MKADNQSKSPVDGGDKHPRQDDSCSAASAADGETALAPESSRATGTAAKISENQASKLMRYFGDPEVERALAPYAVMSSTAHVSVLVAANIISEGSGLNMIAALKCIGEELHEGASLATRENADLYAGLERRLAELVGDSAHMLREGLTTEEQLATDSRLWIRSAALELLGGLNIARSVLLTLAERDIEAVMPGYIHLQPDTPGLLSHFWLLCESRLARDSQRLRDLYARVNRCPLGKNAFSNTGQAVEREQFAALLGFDGMVEENFDVVSDRDYIFHSLPVN